MDPSPEGWLPRRVAIKTPRSSPIDISIWQWLKMKKLESRRLWSMFPPGQAILAKTKSLACGKLGSMLVPCKGSDRTSRFTRTCFAGNSSGVRGNPATSKETSWRLHFEAPHKMGVISTSFPETNPGWFFGVILWMDKILHHFEAMRKPFFAAVFTGGDHQKPGFLRWCEHPVQSPLR